MQGTGTAPQGLEVPWLSRDVGSGRKHLERALGGHDLPTLGVLLHISQFQPVGFCWLCSVPALPAVRLPQYFPWPELLAVSDCGIKVSFAIFYIPARCWVLAEGRLSACSPDVSGATRCCCSCGSVLHRAAGSRRQGLADIASPPD